MNEPRKRRSGSQPRERSRKPRRRSGTIEPLHPIEEIPDVESFGEWDLGDEVQAAIKDMQITTPTPIQAMAIGPVLDGKDVIAKAETGTGKTLAFGAPMIARIDAGRSSVLGLVLSPTRELAEQVHNVLEELGKSRGIRTALIVGGENMVPQVKALQGGAQVVVGTPGRVLDLMNQGFLSFPWTEYAVLDEADKMLEIGFIDDVKKILEACNEYRQTLLFSATFPPPLLTLAREYTKDPVEIATASGMATVDTITQLFLKVSDEDRVRALARMIDSSAKHDVFLVFCERRTDVDRLLRRLERERFSIKALHGGYDQASRFRVMSAFRTGEVKALLATDVASRGLDVEHVTYVINYGVPRDISDYTHRIGRTGRAGRKGTAVTLVSPTDARRWSSLTRDSNYEIAERFSPSAVHGGAEQDSGRPATEGREPRQGGGGGESRGPRRRDRSSGASRSQQPRGRNQRRKGARDDAGERRGKQQGGRGESFGADVQEDRPKSPGSSPDGGKGRPRRPASDAGQVREDPPGPPGSSAFGAEIQ